MSELKLPSSVTGQRAAQQYLKFFSRDVANARDVYNQQLNDHVYHGEFGVEEPDYSEEDLRRQYNDANANLQQYNDAEILDNLDAAVAANSERIQTNNNHIAALDAVSNAYARQAQAQANAKSLLATAAKQQTNADNTQTVSNMISAIPENPSPQQISMITQAIEANSDVYGEQGAIIISNLKKDPPDIKAASATASSVASTANAVAQRSQQDASRAKSDAEKASTNLESVKESAIASGVSESDVASPAAASNASKNLQEENSNLVEVNNNAQNAKEYIRDRRNLQQNNEILSEIEKRQKLNEKYRISYDYDVSDDCLDRDHGLGLYDLRNIRGMNFRNSNSMMVRIVGHEQQQNSKSFYMHLDYVFSNDLNSSSIDPKYKQNIQPIILNEFQPSEMIKVADIINGTLKGLGPLLEKTFGIVGDLARPATKFVTNVLIERASADPTILYPKNKKDNSNLSFSDMIFDPVLKVRNMFRRRKVA